MYNILGLPHVHCTHAVLKNILKNDNVDVAYQLRDGLEDESKMQKPAN
jgi:hypothetical protein